MTAIDHRTPGQRLHSQLVNVITLTAAAHQVLVPRAVREAMASAALSQVAWWLTTDPVVGPGGAAIVAHDVDDCTHLPERDCYDDQALRAYTAAADLIRPYTQVPS